MTDERGKFPSKPRRRFVVTINVEGDEWEDVARTLDELLGHVQRHGPGCSSVSGGYRSGHWVHVSDVPEITHEVHARNLETYLAALKAQREGGSDGL